MRDPSDVTRQLVAHTLTDTEPAFGPAHTLWLRDEPVRWLHQCLRVAVGYRTLRSLLSDDDGAIADHRAAEVATTVAARDPTQLCATSAAPSPHTSAGDVSDLLAQALRALDRIEAAARVRETALVPDAAATRRAFALASLRSVLTWQSQTLRHALRTALGVLLTFLVAWATVGSSDPLVTSMAMAAFAILQISWTESLFKAKQRLLGVTGGALVLSLALWLLPSSLLLPFAALAAFTGLWMMASNQVLSIGSFVVVSVGMNVVSRGLDPARTLIEYILLLFTGVAIGLLIGFAVVPHLRPKRVDERVRLATETTTDVLRAIAALPPAATWPSRRRSVPKPMTRPLFRMGTAVLNLGSPLHHKDEQAGIQLEDCAALATRFETLAIVGLLEVSDGGLTSATLRAAADALGGRDTDAPTGDACEAGSVKFVRLASGVGRRSTEFVEACAEATEPREHEA